MLIFQFSGKASKLSKKFPKKISKNFPQKIFRNLRKKMFLGQAGTPSDIRAQTTSSSALTYSWTRPKCDESFGPIEQFEYRFWPLDMPQPSRGQFTSETQVRLTNLRPDTRYGFECRSVSRAGQSPWSQTVEAKTSRPAAQLGSAGTVSGGAAGACKFLFF